MTKKADAKPKTTKTSKPTAPIKPKSKALSPLIARTVENAIAAHKQAGADALASIELNRRNIAESFFDIATDLAVLRRVEVYSAMGHASFDEVIPLTGFARTTAFALLKLPQHFTRHTAIALGPEKSTALIRFVQSTEEDDDAETLARQDASIAGKPISALTSQEIEQAARDALPVEKKKKLPGEKEAHSTRHAVQKTLASLKAGVRVKRVKGKWIAVVEMPVEAALKLTAKR
jgi:hypothetical protein